MNQKQLLDNHRKNWNMIADDWFGVTCLPRYGCYIPTEDDLKLFPDLTGKTVLDIGCGSGHSLKWCAEHGARELYGVDLSDRQLENAQKLLTENGYFPKLFRSPMEEDCGIPKNYFDVVYSIYAIGWTTDLQHTFDLIGSEETDSQTLAQEAEFTSKYYSPFKAKKFPLSFVIKAIKL